MAEKAASRVGPGDVASSQPAFWDPGPRRVSASQPQAGAPGVGWGVAGEDFCLLQEGRHCSAYYPLLSPLSLVTCAASCSQGWPGQSGRDIPHIAVPGERLG